MPNRTVSTCLLLVQADGVLFLLNAWMLIMCSRTKGLQNVNVSGLLCTVVQKVVRFLVLLN